MSASSLAQGVRIPLPPEFKPGNYAFQHGLLRVLMTEIEDHGAEGQWRHVSVSMENRLPTYEELGAVRSLYFAADATVLQVMPPESEWVNTHRYCLHLWQRLDANVLPQGLHSTVGVRGSIPMDALEVQLVRAGHDLAAALHNLLRVRGELGVQEAQEVLGPVFKEASPQELRHGIRVGLLELARIAPGVSQVNRHTFRFVQEAPR